MFLLLLTLLPSTEVEGMRFRSNNGKNDDDNTKLSSSSTSSSNTKTFPFNAKGKKDDYTRLSSSSTSSSNQLAAAAAAGGGAGGGDDDRQKAGKNMTKIINKLGKKCDKLSEEQCSKKSFTINKQKFTCAWDPNVEKEDKSIGQCVPSAESYERIFPLQAN
ncbi:hypothetical protein GPALN_005925 [Globodera pallida]|nr:hypothetical protein GPALN_005925 [Globodera pallida]